MTAPVIGRERNFIRALSDRSIGSTDVSALIDLYVDYELD